MAKDHFVVECTPPSTGPPIIQVQANLAESGLAVSATYLWEGTSLRLAELVIRPIEHPTPEEFDPFELQGPLIDVPALSESAATNLPESGVGARHLRDVPLQALYRHAALTVRGHLADQAYAKGVPFTEAGPLPELRRTGRHKTSEAELARFASEYVERLRTSASPVQDMADHYELSQAQIRDRISKARDRGLLTRPGRGRAGGDLTRKGAAAYQAWIDEERET